MTNQEDTPEFFPLHKRVSIITWIFHIILAALFTGSAIRCVTNPSGLSITLFVGILIAIAFHYFARKPATPPCFYITPTRAGFGNHHRDPWPVPFEHVTLYHETPSGISITHDSISVPLGIQLHRHWFTARDWEVITNQLANNIRKQAPNAEVITLLDSPREA